MYSSVVKILNQLQKNETTLQSMANKLKTNIPTIVGVINSSEQDLIEYSEDGLRIYLKEKLNVV